MNHSCRTHRPPMPPICDRDAALEAVAVPTDGGRAPCVVLGCLDVDRRPLTMFVIEGSPPTAEPLVLALDVLLEAVAMQPVGVPLDALVMASSRPGQVSEPTVADRAAWDAVDARCEAAGIELLDWFILADGAWNSVPDLLGEPDRW